jgi:hypothetical protein
MVCKKNEVRKGQKKALQMYFHSNGLVCYYFLKKFCNDLNDTLLLHCLELN